MHNEKTYMVFFQLMLLLCFLQQHVCLREFGFQQLFFQVSVLENLFQVLEDIQVDLSRFHRESCFISRSGSLWLHKTEIV